MNLTHTLLLTAACTLGALAGSAAAAAAGQQRCVWLLAVPTLAGADCSASCTRFGLVAATHKDNASMQVCSYLHTNAVNYPGAWQAGRASLRQEPGAPPRRSQDACVWGCHCCPAARLPPPLPAPAPAAGARRGATSGCEVAYLDGGTLRGKTVSSGFYCCCTPRDAGAAPPVSFGWAPARSLLGCAGLGTSLGASADNICSAVSADGSKVRLGCGAHEAVPVQCSAARPLLSSPARRGRRHRAHLHLK